MPSTKEPASQDAPSLLTELAEIKAELAAIQTALHLILALHLPSGPPPTTLVGDRLEHAHKLATDTHKAKK